MLDVERTLQLKLDDEALRQLQCCANWRKVSVDDLVRAYVLDWLTVDYPESQGRLTRKGIYRDELTIEQMHS